MGTGTSLRRISRAAALVAAGALGGGAAFAVASVPDDNGVIHACIQVQSPGGVPVTTSANVRVIDSSAGQSCHTAVGAAGPAPETALNWNATGPQGPTGPPGPQGTPGANGAGGAPGKSVTIAAGHTLTLGGGQVITVGGGTGGVTINTPTVNPRGRALGGSNFGGKADLSFDDLLSVSFAVTGGSGGAGKTKIHELTITKKIDKATPLLNQACASGKHFPTVKITLRKAGKAYLVYELKTVVIASFEQSGSGGRDSLPVEHLTLQYGSISFKYS